MLQKIVRLFYIFCVAAIAWAQQLQQQSPAELLFHQGRFHEALTAAQRTNDRDLEIQSHLELLPTPKLTPELRQLIDRHLDQTAQHYGKNSPQYGQALLYFAEGRRMDGDTAIANYLEARKLCGPGTPCEAMALRLLAMHYRELIPMPTLVEAQAWAEQAWKLDRSRFGEDSVPAAYSMAVHASAIHESEAVRGRDLARQAIDKLRKTGGPNHPYLAWALSFNAIAEFVTGQQDRAKANAEEAIRIYTAFLGPENGQVAPMEAFLGYFDMNQGSYDAARNRFLAAIRHAEGSDDETLAQALNYLSLLQLREGDRIAARQSLERALTVLRRGKRENMNYALTLNNLGNVVLDAEEARRSFLEAHRIATSMMGEGNSNAIVALANAARASMYLGDKTAALKDATQAVDLAAKHLGENSTTLQTALYCRGVLLIDSKRYDEARADIERARAMQLARGVNELTLSSYSEAIATIDLAQGRYAEAARASQDAIARASVIHELDFPERHEAWALLAQAQFGMGQRAEALESAVRSERIRRGVFSVLAAAMPGRYELFVKISSTRMLDLLSRLASLDAKAVVPAWDAVVRSRGAMVDSAAERSRLANSTRDPVIGASARKFDAARNALANAVMMGRRGLSSADYAKRIDELRARVDSAEFDLLNTGSTAAFGKARRRETQAGLDEALAKLPTNAALLAFYRSQDRYTVFVATAQQAAAPQAVDLGAAKPIDDAVLAYRAEIAREMTSGGRDRKRNEERARDAGTALRRLVWDPAVAKLPLRLLADPEARVFIVPDGSLTAINFASLPSAAPGGRYLAESGPLLHLLSTERELAAVSEPVGATTAALLSVGDPAFSGAAARPTSTSKTRGALMSFAAGSCTDPSQMRFDNLPATSAEARSVVAAWKRAPSSLAAADLLLGADATEGAVKRLAQGKRVLHIASHGFFLSSGCPGVQADPMLRTGVALSGANLRKSDGGAEDGILTGAEISGLNLQGTSWAVLSGCDTGTGDVLAGEGLLGLRRAFQTAGVRTIIASLWPVDDAETRDWMAVLYASHFAKGRDTAQAVRDAQRARIAARRKAGASTHPFYWAAFVADGDWR